jgi:hypothetical protein
MSCSCKTTTLSEDASFEETKLTDPSILAYKKALKELTPIIQTAKNSSDGKQLGDEYWEKISKLLKKAKLGIAMFELGLDDKEGMESGDGDVTPMGDVRDGEDQFDNEEDEREEEEAEKEKEKEEAEKEEKSESISEDAKSTSQQRLFGMVYALKKGDLKKDSVSKTLWEKIKKIADGISLDDAKDFAETTHSDLPDRIPATESKDSLLDSARHLGVILESEGSKIKSMVHFNGGLLVEISKGDRLYYVSIGKQVSLEGVDYSIDLGDKTDFGLVSEKFNRLSEKPESELKSIW